MTNKRKNPAAIARALVPRYLRGHQAAGTHLWVMTPRDEVEKPGSVVKLLPSVAHAIAGTHATRIPAVRTLEVADLDRVASSAVALGWTWTCPACRQPVVWSSGEATCFHCDRIYAKEGGIWRFLPSERVQQFAEFARRYRMVRDDERWGSSEAAYYRSLPFVPDSDRHADIWRRRARSYQRLIDRVVVPLEANRRQLAVVDLGAGNGWLSARLTARGHRVAAVDLSDHPLDGLGAHVWYSDERPGSETPFSPVQSEFDRLPFDDKQADLVVFNGALHYSTNVATTLEEALRLARPDARIVIMDTPCYDDPTSGARMVAERDERFTRRYGFAGNALSHEHFLTTERLRDIGEDLGVSVTIIGAESRVRDRLRRARARLRGHRQPASFPLIIIQRPGRSIDQGWLASTTVVSELRGAAHFLKSRTVGPWSGSTPANRGEMARSHVKEASNEARDYAHSSAWGVRSVASVRRSPHLRRFWRLLLRLKFRLTQRHRHRQYVMEHVAGHPIVVFPTVFNPKLLRTGEFLAQTLNRTLIPPGSTVLDMGTGSGVGAVVAARWAIRVVAVDINIDAVRCARTNALLNRVEDRIDVRHGDLFGPVASERFDVVLFNPPYFRGAPRNVWDQAWRSVDVVERFASTLVAHLSAEGVAYVVLSTDGDLAAFLAAFATSGLALDVISRRDAINETLLVYRLRQSAAGG